MFNKLRFGESKEFIGKALYWDRNDRIKQLNTKRNNIKVSSNFNWYTQTLITLRCLSAKLH